jgi:5'-3' exonuclease
MKKGDHLFLVDGSGLSSAPIHALPPLTRKSDGLPVGAVSGFCNMLWKLLVTDARNTEVGVTPTHFAVIFDYSAKTFRKDLYDAVQGEPHRASGRPDPAVRPDPPGYARIQRCPASRPKASRRTT